MESVSFFKLILITRKLKCYSTFSRLSPHSQCSLHIHPASLHILSASLHILVARPHHARYVLLLVQTMSDLVEPRICMHGILESTPRSNTLSTTVLCSPSHFQSSSAFIRAPCQIPRGNGRITPHTTAPMHGQGTPKAGYYSVFIRV